MNAIRPVSSGVFIANADGCAVHHGTQGAGEYLPRGIEFELQLAMPFVVDLRRESSSTYVIADIGAALAEPDLECYPIRLPE